jgi:hypothetical protein
MGLYLAIQMQQRPQQLNHKRQNLSSRHRVCTPYYTLLKSQKRLIFPIQLKYVKH